jgi:hypothetical protein
MNRFTEADMDKEYDLGHLIGSGFLADGRGPIKLRDIITRLKEVYASKVGVEYMHIWDYEQASAAHTLFHPMACLQTPPRASSLSFPWVLHT